MNENINMPLGLPSVFNTNDYCIITERDYTLAYDNKKQMPLFVGFIKTSSVSIKIFVTCNNYNFYIVVVLFFGEYIKHQLKVYF